MNIWAGSCRRSVIKYWSLLGRDIKALLRVTLSRQYSYVTGSNKDFDYFFILCAKSNYAITHSTLTDYELYYAWDKNSIYIIKYWLIYYNVDFFNVFPWERYFYSG